MAKQRRLTRTLFQFQPFSRKQKKILTWWLPESPVSDCKGVIADGSVRSGKTLSMSLSYVMWAMSNFNETQFGMAGKTVGSFRRNVIFGLKSMLTTRGYKYKEYISTNILEVSRGDVTNYFHIFGGQNESSQDLVQGMTAGGFFFDEVALMPESFVNQALSRCSLEGSKYFFNCNPAGPYHWFKTNWIDKAEEKNMLHLHFTMDDNLTLSEEIKEAYRKMFVGPFFKRYILGLWVAAEGIIYDMFDEQQHVITNDDELPNFEPGNNYVSVDYGTQNPTVFLLWQKGKNGIWYCTKEYHYSGREHNKQKTDTEFADDLAEFVGETHIKQIIIDPSAASFIQELKGRGWNIRKAKNDVLDGIRVVGTALVDGKFKVLKRCKHTIKEFYAYTWDPKAMDRGEDKPIKENDHAMDALRYFIFTIASRRSSIRFLQ